MKRISRKRKREVVEDVDHEEKEQPPKKKRKVQKRRKAESCSEEESSSSEEESSSGSSESESSEEEEKKKPKKKISKKKKAPAEKKKKFTRKKKAVKKKRKDVDNETKDDLVKSLVRFILTSVPLGRVVRKDDIRKQVLSKFPNAKGHVGLLEKMIKRANDQLRLIFGFELTEMKKKLKRDDTVQTSILSQQVFEKAKSKTEYVYVLQLSPIPSPSFRYTEEELQQKTKELMSKQQKQENGLLFMILSFIYGEHDSISEVKLWRNLERLGLKKGVYDYTFGEKPERILEMFCRKFFLRKVKDEEESEIQDRTVYNYVIGPRVSAVSRPKTILTHMHQMLGQEVSGDEKKDLEDYNSKMEKQMAERQKEFQAQFAANPEEFRQLVKSASQIEEEQSQSSQSQSQSQSSQSQSQSQSSQPSSQLNEEVENRRIHPPPSSSSTTTVILDDEDEDEDDERNTRTMRIPFGKEEPTTTRNKKKKYKKKKKQSRNSVTETTIIVDDEEENKKTPNFIPFKKRRLSQKVIEL